MSIVKVFVFKCAPVGYHQAVGIVLCPRHILDRARGEHGTPQVACTPFDDLRTIVVKLARVLVELYGVADYRAYRRRRYDVRIESVFIKGLLLLSAVPSAIYIALPTVHLI